jgi:hypothetical protein
MSTPLRSDPQFWKSYWRGIYGAPRIWASKGENLVHAFEAVSEASDRNSIQFNLHDQAFMLAGMGIEVMLKAILVSDAQLRELFCGDRSPITQQEKLLCQIFYSHRIDALAEAAGMALTSSLREVAQALSSYIYWRGRYVVPTERGIGDLVPIEHSNGLVGPPLRQISLEEVNDLIKLVVSAVHTHLGNAA